jgi:hypothetical protein
MSKRPLTDATMAATILTPQIVDECRLAEHADGDEDSKHRRLAKALDLTRELVTRLECAQLLFYALTVRAKMDAKPKATG